MSASAVQPKLATLPILSAMPTQQVAELKPKAVNVDNPQTAPVKPLGPCGTCTGGDCRKCTSKLNSSHPTSTDEPVDMNMLLLMAQSKDESNQIKLILDKVMSVVKKEAPELVELFEKDLAKFLASTDGKELCGMALNAKEEKLLTERRLEVLKPAVELASKDSLEKNKVLLEQLRSDPKALEVFMESQLSLSSSPATTALEVKPVVAEGVQVVVPDDKPVLAKPTFSELPVLELQVAKTEVPKFEPKLDVSKLQQEVGVKETAKVDIKAEIKAEGVLDTKGGSSGGGSDTVTVMLGKASADLPKSIVSALSALSGNEYVAIPSLTVESKIIHTAILQSVTYDTFRGSQLNDVIKIQIQGITSSESTTQLSKVSESKLQPKIQTVDAKTISEPTALPSRVEETKLQPKIQTVDAKTVPEPTVQPSKVAEPKLQSKLQTMDVKTILEPVAQFSKETGLKVQVQLPNELNVQVQTVQSPTLQEAKVKPLTVQFSEIANSKTQVQSVQTSTVQSSQFSKDIAPSKDKILKAHVQLPNEPNVHIQPVQAPKLQEAKAQVPIVKLSEILKVQVQDKLEPTVQTSKRVEPKVQEPVQSTSSSRSAVVSALALPSTAALVSNAVQASGSSLFSKSQPLPSSQVPREGSSQSQPSAGSLPLVFSELKPGSLPKPVLADMKPLASLPKPVVVILNKVFTQLQATLGSSFNAASAGQVKPADFQKALSLFHVFSQLQSQPAALNKEMKVALLSLGSIAMSMAKLELGAAKQRVSLLLTVVNSTANKVELGASLKLMTVLGELLAKRGNMVNPTVLQNLFQSLEKLFQNEKMSPALLKQLLHLVSTEKSLEALSEKLGLLSNTLDLVDIQKKLLELTLKQSTFSQAQQLAAEGLMAAQVGSLEEKKKQLKAESARQLRGIMVKNDASSKAFMLMFGGQFSSEFMDDVTGGFSEWEDYMKRLKERGS